MYIHINLKSLVVIDLKTSKEIIKYSYHSAMVNSACSNKDGSILVTCSSDK